MEIDSVRFKAEYSADKIAAERETAGVHWHHTTGRDPADTASGNR